MLASTLTVDEQSSHYKVYVNRAHFRGEIYCPLLKDLTTTAVVFVFGSVKVMQK